MSKQDRDTNGDPAPFFHADHPRPRTRREFLAQGFIHGMAWFTTPSLVSLLRSREAKAQLVDCGLGSSGGKLPFLVVDLAGGASLAGSNVLVGTNTQFDLLSAEGYAKMGLPIEMTPIADPAVVDTSMGLAFHRDSALLRGIRMRAQPTTLDRVNGCIFAARSDNDTGNNPHNPVYGVNAAGAGGSLMTLAGNSDSDTGGNSAGPATMFDPIKRPTQVRNPDEARGLVDTGELLALLGSSADAEAVAAAAQAISGSKIARLPESDLVREILACAYEENRQLVGGFGDPNAIDPRVDAAVLAVMAPGDFSAREFTRSATLAKLVLDEYAGAATVELGGYDYHDGTRASGERKDERAGQAIGIALEIAARKNRPLVIYLISDGSVASDGVVDDSPDGAGKLVWRNDNAGSAASVMLVFDPDIRPSVTDTGHQIGSYRPTGSVETMSSLVGDNVTALAEAVVLNYLALHGEAGRLDSVLPNHILGGSASVREGLTAFAPLQRFS